MKYYAVAVFEFDSDGAGTTRTWFLNEETMRGIEGDWQAKFGPPMAEALSSSLHEPSVVLLTEDLS